MVKNKMLLNAYRYLKELFEGEIYVESEREAREKIKAKTEALTREKNILRDLINVNLKIINAYDIGEQVDGLLVDKEILKLKKENLHLEYDFASKMDFLGQYEKRIIVESEQRKEFTKKVKSDIGRVVMEIETRIPKVKDGTQEKIVMMGMVHQYVTKYKDMNDDTRNTLYKQMVDMLRRTEITEQKQIHL